VKVVASARIESSWSDSGASHRWDPPSDTVKPAFAVEDRSMARSRVSLLNLFMIAHIIQWRFMGRTVSPMSLGTIVHAADGFVNGGLHFLAWQFGDAHLGRLLWLGLSHTCVAGFLRLLLKKMVFIRSRSVTAAGVFPLGAALYMFVWPVAYRLFSKPAHEPHPEIHQSLVHTNFGRPFRPSRLLSRFCLFAVRDSLFLGKKLLHLCCPYGGFFGLADKFSQEKFASPACNKCGHCTATCTSNVQVHAEVSSTECVSIRVLHKCMDCVSVCQRRALLRLWKPALWLR